MDFVSTADPRGRRFALAEAVRLGPAPDGGLFMPARLPALVMAGTAAPGVLAARVLAPLLEGALDATEVAALAAAALDFPMPLREVAEVSGRRLAVLELFHGPTLAFKDVGARFLARLLPRLGGFEGATVLVATSGDTGGAVAQAFHGVPGTRVVVLYPRGKVSELQERQFATLGGNVHAFAVDGTFDDCQRLVKEAFADRELAQKLRLTSANSINIGRLLPQIVYYVLAARQAKVPEGGELVFATPSGNFGNLTAGLMAKAMGLRCRFVAATNANDVVPAYLETGLFAPRPSIATLSNAMDVGAPNNFPRILHLYGHDLASLRRDVRGESVDDGETRATIRRVWREHGYLLDPHTAVGWRALERALPAAPPGSVGVVLGTAHPAKFADAVEAELGEPVPLPEGLRRHLGKNLLGELLPADARALERRLLQLEA